MLPVPDEMPLLSLYLTDRCNSRCVTCDHWRHGRDDLTLDAVRALLPGLQALRTRIVQVTGGEPLVHPEWQKIVQLLRDAGMRVWLLTAGLALAKQAHAVARLTDHLIVSLDAAERATYAAIRGLDAFDKVCEGIRAAAALGRAPTLRVTLQRANYRQLPDLVRLARDLGAHQISFLTVDSANAHAFGRAISGAITSPASLGGADLPVLEAILATLERQFAAEFASGFIAESPHKLRRMHQYFAAVCGAAPYPKVDCRAPEFSAVVDSHGRLHPCYFISGSDAPHNDVRAALTTPAMAALRESIAAGARAECRTCVCTLSRAPAP